MCSRVRLFGPIENRDGSTSLKTITPFVALLLMSCFTACSHSTPGNTNHQTQQPTTSDQNKQGSEKSSLSGLIKNVSLYPVPDHRGDLAISLVVSVRNSGAADRAEGWTLEVNSPSSGVPTGLEPVHVNGVVELPGSNKSVDLAKEDLTVKGTDLIGRNSQVEGVLTFVLPSTEEHALNHNSSSLVLHFKDSQGNSYQTPRTYIGQKVAE